MIQRPERLVLAAVLLAGLACTLSGPSALPSVPGPPVTPALFLPPEWTPTPAPPTPEVPTGWEEFHGDGVHLWLPESFEGGDMGTKFQGILDTLKSLGPDFAQMAQTIEQNPDVFVLWAFDTQPGPSGYITNVNITREDVPGGFSVEDYLDASLQLMPSSFELVERSVMSLGGI